MKNLRPMYARNTLEQRRQESKQSTLHRGAKLHRSITGGWRLQLAETSWVAVPFGFGIGGPLFARCVVADLQVGAFDFRECRRNTSLKAGHYKIEQQDHGPFPVRAQGVATGLKTLALFDVGEWNFGRGTEYSWKSDESQRRHGTSLKDNGGPKPAVIDPFSTMTRRRRTTCRCATRYRSAT
jgi:hypothetical protein